MEKRYEPMTPAERRRTRLSAFFVVVVAIIINAIAYFVMFEFAGDDDGDFAVIKLAFMAFFAVIALIIVVTNIVDAIRAEKLVRTGTVTAKDVRSSRGKNADALAQFVVELDGTECTVDAETFKKINVGESITLTTSRSGNTVIDLRVLEPVRHTTDVLGRDVIEPMDGHQRRKAALLFLRSALWRVLLIAVSAVVPIIVMIFLIGFDSPVVFNPITRTIFTASQIVLPLILALLLLRKPLRIALDIWKGQVLNEVRPIRDVVTSNRRLAGKTGLQSGWGDVTTYTYVDTGEAFVLCAPSPPPAVGGQVVIARLPRSRAILDVYALE